jgi:hypothetical protein
VRSTPQRQCQIPVQLCDLVVGRRNGDRAREREARLDRMIGARESFGLEPQRGRQVFLLALRASLSGSNRDRRFRLFKRRSGIGHHRALGIGDAVLESALGRCLHRRRRLPRRAGKNRTGRQCDKHDRPDAPNEHLALLRIQSALMDLPNT